ncbi:uncharacterized protein LOC114270657 [Camellia sinensis]|uniref:uncharacterized protein LOC114270657 n=1 Tax=Camellia sinensis TaxID=4442 RepID=UPI00103605BB|nr:uncharacterized protein LOC114270657 [Camellia sinensis]
MARRTKDIQTCSRQRTSHINRERSAKLLSLYIAINAVHHSIYYDNTSPSEQYPLTLNKVSYSIDFRPRWQVGRDGEMVTKGYKQTLKIRRRFSGGLGHLDIGWRSVNQSDPFPLKPVVS